jgi:hypothetical protein
MTTGTTRPTRRRGRPRDELKDEVKNSILARSAFVDPIDWIAVISGQKTEWRVYGHANFLDKAVFPAPVVAYSPSAADPTIPYTAVLTLEEMWREPLAAITDESLRREGFTAHEDRRENLADFRRYFTARYPNGGFRPIANVICRRVHPITPDEQEEFMRRHWHHLYGRWAQ